MQHSLSSKLASQTSPLSLAGRLIAPNMADKSQTPAHPCPIAVVGMACRIPGGVSTPEDLWTLISRSRDGWCEIPDDRFSKEAYYHPNPQKSGAMNVEGGYFLKRDVSKFDAQFFNITKQEAIAMDPAQRQMLEVTFEALESAGLSKEKMAGSRTGVFIGTKVSDYNRASESDASRIPTLQSTGNHGAVQAGRLSYYFDFRGPSFSIDTACSSGLYAVHAAVQSIRSGESDAAVVAAACLRLQPDDMISMSMMSIYNPKGKTFAFDHRAESGYAPGEGVACLVLKPLDQAIRDNDRIRSVILNTGTNQDGKTTNLTTPNSSAQEALIREVYASAGLDPRDTGFIEAHGTGTKVGDPIEAHALYRVFGTTRPKNKPISIGSVKTNIGHLENASGIVAIIKASLMLERKFIAPNCNFEMANPNIPMDEWNLRVAKKVRPWPRDKKYISVNNFGFGGSNAHAVMGPPPLPPFDTRATVASATPTTLRNFRQQRQQRPETVYCLQHPEEFDTGVIFDIAYTLGERRTHLPYRIACTASSTDELGQMLQNPSNAPKLAPTVPKLAFVYTGQGAQWPAMGLELLQSYPIFAESIKAADQVLDELHAGFSIEEELRRDFAESRVGEPQISQAACTALQLGLTDLLRSWGVKPLSVIGHSSGEIAAAYATGAICLKEAMAIAYYRGKLASSLKGVQGAMIAVGQGAEETRAMIKELGFAGISVACENAPESTTVSGDASAIDQLATHLERTGIMCRKLRVDVAYHSAHMKLVADEYMAALKDIVKPQEKSDVAIFSSLLGRSLDNTSSLTASYWIDNLTMPVLFDPGLQSLVATASPDIVIELGPHSALQGPIKQILKAIGGTQKYLPSLARNQNATVSVLNLAGGLFVGGYPVKMDAVNFPSSPEQMRLAPIHDFTPYPWEEGVYWNETRSSKQRRLRPFAPHDLLGLLEASYSDAEPAWRNLLSTENVPWLREHRMQTLTTFPLAGYLCTAVEALSQYSQLHGIDGASIKGYHLREVEVAKAFILEDDYDYETLITLRPYAEGTRANSDKWHEFRFSSWSRTRGWLEHCRCLISTDGREKCNPVSGGHLTDCLARLRASTSAAGVALKPENFYAELDRRGAGYGPLFQVKSDLMVSKDYATAYVTMPDTASVMPYQYEAPSLTSPAFMDLIIQTVFPLINSTEGDKGSLWMPSAIKDLQINNPMPDRETGPYQSVTRGQDGAPGQGSRSYTIDLWHPTQREEPIMTFTGLCMTPVRDEAASPSAIRKLCFKVQWETLSGSHQSELESHMDEASNSVRAFGDVDDLDSGTSSGSEGKMAYTAPTEKFPTELDTGASSGFESDDNTERLQRTFPHVPRESFVVITAPGSSSDLTMELVALLEATTGKKPTLGTVHDVSVSGRPCICLAEVAHSVLETMNKELFEVVQRILLDSSSILWVTSGSYRFAERPETNIAHGLLRTLRSETGKLATTLDLDPKSQLSAWERAALVLEAVSASFTPPQEDGTVEFEFAEDHGKLSVPRIVPVDELNLLLSRESQDHEPYEQPLGQPGRRLKMAVKTLGALDSLLWEDDTAAPALGPGDVEIKVHATGMNFKDVVVAMGQVAQPYIGIECAGVVTRVGHDVRTVRAGDRVCALPLGAYSTYASCHYTSVAIIPPDMEFTTAASIPIVFATAYYALVDKASLQRSDKVLIHAGSGGVGQAAIQVAQSIGAEIFTTVGTLEKKQHIMETYGIPESRIFFSRDSSFGPAVRAATGGEGVDVVLNSLAGDLLRESWDCIAPFGRFIEIGKRNIVSNSRLEMQMFEKNCSFCAVDLSMVASERPRLTQRVLRDVFDLVASGALRPVQPVTVIGTHEVETGLRTLQSGKSMGKIVVDQQDGDLIKATHHQLKSGMLSGHATYIIVGGTGGLGQSIAERMIHLGARTIVLLSRTGTLQGNNNPGLWGLAHTHRASIHVKSCDVADEASLGAMLREIRQEMPPIRGLVHSAMVLQDVLFERATFDDYSKVVRSKVAGGWNVHNALLQDTLDFFVVLSSAISFVGGRGQAAYAGANAFLDALVQHRVRQGLKATALNLTAVEDAGYVCTNQDRRFEVVRNISGDTIKEAEVLAIVQAAMAGMFEASNNQCVNSWARADVELPQYYRTDGKFAYHRNQARELAHGPDADSGPAALSISDQMMAAPTAEAALDVVATALRVKLGAILMLSDEVMIAQQATTSLSAFGLDSLNAIELRNWIGKHTRAHLQVLEILTTGTLRDAAALVLHKTTLKGAWNTENGDHPST
ncbi:hypothetical protein PG989_012176 [Apiospora arundinis]